VITACTTYFSNGSMLSNKAKLQVIKLNNIGPDGRYVQPYTVEYEYPTPVAGGSSAKPPAQNALAVSTTTGFSRGRAHQGRWYLPIPGAVLADDGRIDPTATSYILQSSRAFVTQLNAALSPWVASVVSNVGPGEQRTITGLKVGRVMDTIRSRREKFDEDYVIGPVP
jgi:hypothetical protein